MEQKPTGDTELLPRRTIDIRIPLTPEQIRTGKIGRNDPCPCGSGKKFKRCHLAPGASKGKLLRTAR